jgi:hypothetical protein
LAKPIFILLFSLFLLGCGGEKAPDRQDLINQAKKTYDKGIYKLDALLSDTSNVNLAIDIQNLAKKQQASLLEIGKQVELLDPKKIETTQMKILDTMYVGLDSIITEIRQKKALLQKKDPNHSAIVPIEEVFRSSVYADLNSLRRVNPKALK